LLNHIRLALVAFGPAGVLALTFLDSTGVPVSAGVDALIIYLAVQSPHSAWLSAILAVAGSTVGNLVLFFAARRGGRRFLERAAPTGRVQKFRAWFERYGLVTVFVPALIPFPMPLKLFVISAGVLRTRVPAFLGVILLARILRYGGDVWLGVALGNQSLGFLEHHVWQFALGGVALFAALFLLVRMNDSSRKALHSPEGIPAEQADIAAQLPVD
jgi:membrane protein DedA with SNARE-associated domain